MDPHGRTCLLVILREVDSEFIMGLECPASWQPVLVSLRSSVRQRHRMGIAHIPEDRHKSGMVGKFTVAENMVLNSYYDEAVTSGVQIDWQRVHVRGSEQNL